MSNFCHVLSDFITKKYNFNHYLLQSIIFAAYKWSMNDNQDDIIHLSAHREYEHGFVSNIETETIPKGLNEGTIRLISQKKDEPDFMLEFRLKAYRKWLKMKMPQWAHLVIPEIDYQDIIYYAAPKQKPVLNSMDEVDPELRRTFEKLGIPLEEQKLLAGVAVDAVMDSISVKTTFREELAKHGVIFC